MDEGVSSFHDLLLLKLLTALLLIDVCQCSQSDVDALLAFRNELNSGPLADWTGNSPCNWTGIACESSGNVVSVSLPGFNLIGRLHPLIGNLTFLTTMDLSQNSFSGPIPGELANCQKLQHLDLSRNQFQSNFSTLLRLRNLVTFSLAGNMIYDTISPALGELVMLKELNLSCTLGLAGQIPDSIGNCTSLQRVDLTDNALTGNIPPSIFQLPQLTELALSKNRLNGTLDLYNSTALGLMSLSLDDNELMGEIPEAIFNLSKLVFLDMSENQLTGGIPSFLSMLTKLEVLRLSTNTLSGSIPAEVGKLFALTTLTLSHNMFTGSIPAEMFSSQNLQSLNLHNNELTGNIPTGIGNLSMLRTLELNDNILAGSIPIQLSNCSNLSVIDLGMNGISGFLPTELTTLSNLSRLYLTGNQLIGTVPPKYLSLLPKLEHILLSENSLTGEIPNVFPNTSQLLKLEMANNKLQGPLPASLGKLRSVEMLDLSNNQLNGNLEAIFCQSLDAGNGMTSPLQNLILRNNKFNGSLPAVWNCMLGLLTLDLSKNLLTGQIPSAIGDLFLVQLIDLSFNELGGQIPAEIGNLDYLTALNLSNNRLADKIPDGIANSWQRDKNSSLTVDFSSNVLSGPIPQSLDLSNLKLNVSNNNISGSIPGYLQQLSASSFQGNSLLCGPPLSTTCTQPVHLGSKNVKVAVRIVVVAGVLGCLATGTLLGIYCFRARLVKWVSVHYRRSIQVEWIDSTRPSGSGNNLDTTLYGECSSNLKMSKLSLTFADLSKATGNFASERVIGDGGFGKVYKGVLHDGTIVAVKRLTENGCQGEREFVAEVETLGGIRHKNLVRLQGYCSSNLDRLLVYDYMPNNSLDAWLYGRTPDMEPLPWQLRLVIAQDIARGLSFLHHFCVPKVIHRDLKASNILLDANFNARLADFGLARHLNTYESHISTAVAGSLGYIPPEYAQSWRITTRGDVFSFGVVLLELLSGKRPAGGAYKPIHGGNLVGWVQYLYSTNQVETMFFDSALGPIEGSDIQEELMAILKIAVSCTQDDPAKRPLMLEVLRSLEGERR